MKNVLYFALFGSIVLNLYHYFVILPITDHIIEVQEATIDQILGDFERLCREAKFPEERVKPIPFNPKSI